MKDASGVNNQDSHFQTYIFDGSGGAVTTDINGFEKHVAAGEGLSWAHLDYSHTSTGEWLDQQEWLDHIIRDNLLDDDTRPRYIRINDAVFLSLRGVNMNPGSEPEDMVALRLWLTDKYIVTSNRRQMHSLLDIQASLQNGIGPKSTSAFLITLLERLAYRTEKVIEQLEDTVAELEENVIINDDPENKGALAEIRRRAIHLKRYIGPQREALQQLLVDPPEWLTKKHRPHVRERINDFKRFLEILDSVRDRAIVVHEELLGRMSEKLNQRMYILSVVATIFMPLGFITGLLGINVGGIPGGQSAYGFWIICSGIVIVAGCMLFYLKSKKWF